MPTRGIHAFTADGAWRGTHLNQIQTTTGRAVISPPRRRSSRGIVIDGHGHAAQPLPWSRRRIQREAQCGGHQLWAIAGTLFEQIITADGTSAFRELRRHQTKRDTTRHKNGTVRHQFYARYTLPCPGHPDHEWWEPLQPTTDDTKTGFNRCEYLRVVPTTSNNHKRLYGMRQDTESLNATRTRLLWATTSRLGRPQTKPSSSSSQLKPKTPGQGTSGTTKPPTNADDHKPLHRTTLQTPRSLLSTIHHVEIRPPVAKLRPKHQPERRQHLESEQS